jgi:hypothetical protein
VYFLADGIYPDWAIFVKTYSEPVSEKAAMFAVHQEAARKDVECAFGILVAKFHVLAMPLRNWYVGDIQALLYTCIILHNMVVAAKGGKDVYLSEEDTRIGATNNKRWPLFGGSSTLNDTLIADGVDLFAARSGMFAGKMASQIEHFKLKNDLKEHIYDKFKVV